MADIKPCSGSLEMNDSNCLRHPQGPSTQYLRTLVATTGSEMIFGTRVLKCLVLGPSGLSATQSYEELGFARSAEST